LLQSHMQSKSRKTVKKQPNPTLKRDCADKAQRSPLAPR